MATLHLSTLPFLAATIIASSISCSRAFLLSSPITTQISPTIIPSQASSSSTSLYGIQEWRDQAYEEHYTLEIFNQVNPDTPPLIPATVPILPFPFTDILMQGQRKQLNLYEQRFHDLFQDAMDNHHGMIGMGLLLGRGMITTMPLCEIESFTRFGYDEKNWVDTGNGMGNGSIFVTIRAVGRAKIVESDLIQEEPYFKARVVEVVDEPVNMEMGKNIGIKEKGGSSSSSDNNQVAGESSPVEIGSLVASTIENLMVTLSSMEHKLKEINAKKKKDSDSSSSSSQVVAEKQDTEGDQDEVMNKRLAAARLEELFMKDSSDECVDLDDLDSTNARNGEDDEDISSSNEEEDDDDDDDDDDSEILDRVAQFQEAFESAKETDHQGYILPPIPTASDNLSSSENQKVPPLRSPKDLTAISWAAFCTTGGLKDDNGSSSSSSKDSIQRQAIQIQALDMTNVIQRMQLASAMLREEQKSLKAKLALAGIQDILKGGDGGVGGDELS